MSINEGDRVRINSTESSLAYINGRIATVTASNRSGYYLQIDGLKPSVHLSNLQGMQCLDKLTSAQELALALPCQVYDPDLGWQDLPKPIHSVQKYSNLDTPESPTMATSNNGKRGRGRPRKRLLSEAEVSISLPPALPVNPSLTKGTALDNKTPEIVSPTSEKSLKNSNPRTGRSKTSPAYSQSIGENISGKSSPMLTSAGMTVNGSLLAADTLEAPILENDYLYLESPGALGAGISGANPPGQNKLEGQLKEIGSIAPGEVSNPEFLEASLGLPVGWTNPQEEATATEFLAKTEPIENAAKPSEISLTPELPNSPSIASSTMHKRSLSGLVLSEAEVAEVQLDLTSKVQWIDPDQLEEVSFTQIRHSVDAEAIARYAELMRDTLWDFHREPLPVLFNHENRYLIGDGHHRIEAARKIGVKIKCEIFTAWTIEEALLYSIRAVENSNHGVPLRPKDQRKRITMFLDLLESENVSLAKPPLGIVPPEGYQEWSARAIATYLKLPESGYRTVASIRKERIKLEEEPRQSLILSSEEPVTLTDDPPATTTPLSTFIPADTYTPLSTFIPADTSTPSFIPADTFTPVNTPPLPTPPARLAAMVVVILEKIDELNHEQLIELKEAIAAEEVRRLGKILEEEELVLSELVLSEVEVVEVKGSN